MLDEFILIMGEELYYEIEGLISEGWKLYGENSILMVEIATKAIDLYPEYWRGYVARAFGYQSLSRNDLAMDDFVRAESLEPSPENILNRIYQLRHEGRLSEALARLNEVIENNPLDDYIRWRGITHFNLREYEKALEAFVSIYRDDQNSGYILGWIEDIRKVIHRRDTNPNFDPRNPFA